ncbi:ABC transporter permease [Flocculibacter collagenilyticus]|uniref:ABC transporter permease n=1 Tax=Flocculibacter collagenilyticus TaxID=2744479 RepID=UPI0018F6CEC1|nr:ABC transporter permease [Flocculibacter collagenilyticus]
MKRFWAIFYARNLEFWRDKASLGWNIIFPILLVVGFAVIFSGDGKAQYKVGIVQADGYSNKSTFLSTKYISFVTYKDKEKALLKLQQHSLDLLVNFSEGQYWINETSPQGYIVEKLLLQAEPEYQRIATQGKEIRYLDWVLPGILGMNMMFSCLFGVGYVIVRYRKNSVLKRLQATPLSALEFISAQVFSRLLIVLAIVAIIYVGCDLVFDFYMIGSYFDLLIITILGALAMIALGLLLASRSRSEELTGGLLNMATWPMMILSGVWFSLEGAPRFLHIIAQFLPLTHLVEGARAVMSNGDSLIDIQYHVTVLLGMTVLFTGLAAVLFRWEGDGR